MKEKELPEGWVWVRLDDITSKFINGGTPSTAIPEYWNGSILWTTSKSITSYTISAGEKFISHDAIEKSSTNIIPKDNVLIASRVGIGKSAVNLIDIAISQDLTGIILDKKQISLEFLVRYLHTPKILRMLESNARGSTIKGLQRSDLERIGIPLPPLPIQRQIVAVLEQAEAVKRQRQEADALTGALLQSVFYEMFGDPVKNEMGWKVTAVEEICEPSRPITYGIVQPGEETDDGIPIVRPSDLLDTYVNNNIGLKKVDPKIESEYPRSRLKGGEFLISVRGTMGPMSIAGPDLADANLSRGVALVAPNSTCCSEYLLFLFKNPTMQQVVVDTSKGIALKQFNLIDLKKMQIPLPPLALQQQFARVVEEVEWLRERQAASGKEIEGLCEGLMQKAFEGELVV